MSEEWRAVAEDCRYFVSSEGRVRGPRGKILAPRPQRNRYLRVGIGKGRDRLIHRLVCLAFHGPPPTPDCHADHFPDRTRTNNRAANLRWLAPEKNRATRLIEKGEARYNAVLTPDSVRAIRRSRATHAALALKYSVNPQSIANVRKGKTWAHIA